MFLKNVHAIVYGKIVYDIQISIFTVCMSVLYMIDSVIRQCAAGKAVLCFIVVFVVDAVVDVSSMLETSLILIYV